MTSGRHSNLYALIMAGGQGTRFWPASTSASPKQYLKLASKHPLLYETLVRFEGLIPPERRYIVTVKNQAKLARQCARTAMNEEGIIFEPSGRNTAACILLGLCSLLQRGANHDDVVVVTPSDHVVKNCKAFCDTVKRAGQMAFSSDKIVTIGISPTFPHTGFGYIRCGEELGQGISHVLRFVEKPDLETAKSYLASGEYYWNAGLFISTIKTWFCEFEKHAPEIYQYAKELGECGNNFEKLTHTYNQIPIDSIDYAVMEKSREVALIPASFDWSDLGSWDALEGLCEQKEGNTVVACRDVHSSDAKNNIVYAPDRFVSLIGVQDLIVVVSANSVMVLPKSRAQEIKSVVEFLKSREHLQDLL